MHMRALVSSVVLLGGLASAHPGHDHLHEAMKRREFLNGVEKSSLNHCAGKFEARGLDARAAVRRRSMANSLAEKRGLKKRQLESITISHESDEDFDADTDPSIIFAGNSSCVLNVDVTEGPYYVFGESIRSDVTEGQAGVPLTMDIQIIDVETCEPAPEMYFEIWHSNATGVYAGVAPGGSNGDANDKDNWTATFLRGIQKTDEDGVVQFHTVFPGHYTGRTTHIHVMLHAKDTVAGENNTIINTKASHVGQLFFDQDLIYDIEKLEPYTNNVQPLTTNVRDIIIWSEMASGDPFLNFVQIGDSLGDGLLGYMRLGVNTSFVKDVVGPVTLYEEGYVQNERTGMFGGSPPGLAGDEEEEEEEEEAEADEATGEVAGEVEDVVSEVGDVVDEVADVIDEVTDAPEEVEAPEVPEMPEVPEVSVEDE